MRILSPTLLSAQREASVVPYVKVEARNKIAGVVRLDWSRLYTGTEDDCPHSFALAGDGSLIRVRLSPVADGRKLYRQRVANPGPASDFSSWTYTNQYNCLAVASASNGAEVSIFWINDSREIRLIKSTDNGASWGSPELIDYSPTTEVNGLAAAYRPDGDLAIFFTDQTSLFVKKRVSGSWQEKVAWGSPPQAGGNLSGVAAVYSSDWNLIVSGQDSAGNFKLWTLIYGDGGDVPSDSWSSLKEFASAPSDGLFQYCGIFLDKADVYRCFYVEKFTGSAAYNRPYRSHSVPGGRFLDNTWCEPLPFNLSGESGMAIAHFGNFCWLSTPFGVWRASLAETTLDLSADIVSLQQEIGPEQGTLTIEISNDDGKYASLPSPLETGCQLDFSPGYVTSVGNESSAGQTYELESYEYLHSKGKSSLLLQASDGWDRIKRWQAKNQFRWNKNSDEMNVKQILEFVIARAGLKLVVVSQSSVITGYFPDFSIRVSDSGSEIVRKLLSFVPDTLFIEGSSACLVNPESGDISVYAYGQSHSILEGRYRKNAWQVNQVSVEGFDPVADAPIMVDSFNWDELYKRYARLKRVEDTNLETVEIAGQRRQAVLRKAEITANGGYLLIPLNCGQQLYDVIDITDELSGFAAERRRVVAISLDYRPFQGKYEQKLLLGAV